jgi:hypothetical protein
MRRLPPRFLRRRRYEVTFIREGGAEPEWTQVTSTPVTLIDRYLGVGDAWSLVNAADDAWGVTRGSGCRSRQLPPADRGTVKSPPAR